MPVFSHSRILSYETCPLRYKYAYIDQIVPEEQTAEIYLGARVHEALEKLYRNLEFGKLMSNKELLTFFNREWKKNWANSIIIVREEFTPENYRKMGEKYLKDYYKRYKPFKEGKVVDLEITDFLPLDKKGEYSFFIRIDRLMEKGDGLYEIHDYKTNTELPAQKLLDEDRQLAMYSIWVRREFEGCRDVRLVWHFLAFDKEMDSCRTKEQLEHLRQDVLEKIKTIDAAKKFPTNASKLCFWCLYKRICPVGSKIEDKK